MCFGRRLLTVAGLVAALMLAAPLVAAACSGDYDVNTAPLIAEGRVEKVTPRPDLAIPSTLPKGPSPFIPVEVVMRVERVHRGTASGTITFVDHASLIALPDGSTQYAGGAGACGILDRDPTGQYALIVFTGRDDADRWQVNRVAGAAFASGPDAAPIPQVRQSILGRLKPPGLPNTGGGAGDRALATSTAPAVALAATFVVLLHLTKRWHASRPG
jgi:hypothetical protein